MTPDADRACRGDASLHVHLEAAAAGESPRMIIEETQSDQPVPLANRWVRAFVFLPSSSVTPALNRLLIVGQVAAPYRQVELGVTAGKLAITSELGGLPVTVSTTALPTDRWTCVVFALEQGSPGALRATLDDDAVEDLQVTGETNPAPALASVRIGVAFDQLAADQGAIDLWIDEIVIDDAPLDCLD